MKSKQDVEKHKAHKVLWKLRSEIENFKKALLDKGVITPKIAQEKFEKLYTTHQKPLPPGEEWATLFDKELFSLFAFIRENRNDIFESEGKINWENYKNNVRP